MVTVGVQNDLEAAGNLVDVIDAAQGQGGVIMVNVARRDKQKSTWPNGSPFAYFYYRNTLIASSIGGLTLSFVKKLGIAEDMFLLDILTVCKEMAQKDLLDKNLVRQIVSSQFRSFEFLPRVAFWLLKGFKIPANKFSLARIPNPPCAVWGIDSFGNVKTTLLPHEVGFKEGWKAKMKFSKLPCRPRLKDVPDAEAALVIGSSGIEDKRFLEVVIQGGNASRYFGLEVGTIII